MAITVIMQDSRPDGAGGTYKKGSTYSLPDTLATYFIDIGLAKRTSTRSEQTGLQITGDSAGRFPSAPAQDAEDVLKVRRSSAQGVGDILAGDTLLSIPVIKSFPDFSPSILASFVAGTTAVQSGNTVTVTATAHGIVGSTAKNGYRIYYPGSPSIAAGWYSGFAWVDANTITFTNPVSQTVASESVNAGAAFVSQVTAFSATLPGNSLGGNGTLSAKYVRTGDNTAGNKIGRFLIHTSLMTSNGATTSGSITANMTVCVRNGTILSTNSYDSSAGSSQTVGTLDMSVDRSVALTMQVSNAGQWLVYEYAHLEVIYRP